MAKHQRDVVEARTRRGLRIIRTMSFTIAAGCCSYAASFAFQPENIVDTMDVLFTHWVWAGLQLFVAACIVTGHLLGGKWINAAHAVGCPVQSMFAGLSLLSSYQERSGWQIFTGAAVMAVAHWGLTGITWPEKRAQKRS